MVTQLEHQLRLGSLTLQALVFHCQGPLASLGLLAHLAAHAASHSLTSAGEGAVPVGGWLGLVWKQRLQDFFSRRPQSDQSVCGAWWQLADFGVQTDWGVWAMAWRSGARGGPLLKSNVPLEPAADAWYPCAVHVPCILLPIPSHSPSCCRPAQPPPCQGVSSGWRPCGPGTAAQHPARRGCAILQVSCVCTSRPQPAAQCVGPAGTMAIVSSLRNMP